MKIKEIVINKYGPLKNLVLEKLGNFNVIWGYNEEGKTLTIEALIKFLLGKKEYKKNTKQFININRVDEFPDGYCIIETYESKTDKNNNDKPKKNQIKKEIKLPFDTFFMNNNPFLNNYKSKLNNNPLLSIEEFKNIFIIRNSDLLITDEDIFYNNITSKLVGLNSRLIEKVISNVADLARINEKSKEFKDEKGIKLKSRLNEAEKLKIDIELYLKNVADKNFEEIEKEFIRHREKVNLLKKRIERLEIAKRKDLYFEVKEILNKLKNDLTNLKTLKNINRNDYNLLIKFINKIEELNKNEKEIKNRIRELENKISTHIEPAINKLKEEKRVFDKKSGIIDSIRSYIDDYKNSKIEFDKIKDLQKNDNLMKNLGKYLFVIAIILLTPLITFLIVLALSSGFKNNILISILNIFKNIFSLNNYFLLKNIFIGLSISGIVIIIVAAGIFVANYIKSKNIKNKENEIKLKFKKINVELSKISLNGSSLEEVLKNIYNFNIEKEGVEKKLKEFEIQKRTLENNITEYRKRVDDIQVEKKMLYNQIESIYEKAKINSVSIYEDKVNLKENLKDKISKSVQLLLSKLSFEKRVPLYDIEFIKNISFNTKDDILFSKKFNDFINIVETILIKLSNIINIKTEEKFSEDLYNKLKTEIDNSEEIVSNYEQILKEHNYALIDFEKKVTAILNEPVFCSTIKELEKVKLKIEHFIMVNKQIKNDAIILMNILNEINEQEKQKISNLFEENETLSLLFSRLSSKYYKKVIYNDNKSKNQTIIQVLTRDNILLNVNQLSSGAFDQLYFAIRVSIAKMLLNNQGGFFILDDPFIKSDPVRLKILIDMLKNISNEGFQILYFSSKGEIKDILEKDAEKKYINFYDISKIKNK